MPVAIDRIFIGFGSSFETPMGMRFVKIKAMEAKIAWMSGLFSGKSATPIVPIAEQMMMLVNHRLLCIL